MVLDSILDVIKNLLTGGNSKRKRISRKVIKKKPNSNKPSLPKKNPKKTPKNKSAVKKKTIIKKKKVVVNRSKPELRKKPVAKKTSPVKLRNKPKVSKKVVKSKTAIEEAKGELVGEITHFFSRISVIVVKIVYGKLSVGDEIRIKGKVTNFVQKVDSLQLESIDVKVVKKGQIVGLQVKKIAKVGDRVFRLKKFR